MRFHYIKAPTHQEIKVDGAIGGPGPTGGQIAVSVYTERMPIPRAVVHSMTDLGNGRSELGPELTELRDARDGIVRIVQATLHMDLLQAKAVHKWLSKIIETVEEQEKLK